MLSKITKFTVIYQKYLTGVFFKGLAFVVKSLFLH